VKSVLLIDDEPEMREDCSKTLEFHGYRVVRRPTVWMPSRFWPAEFGL